jgi:hypothetical protein
LKFDPLSDPCADLFALPFSDRRPAFFTARPPG